MSCWAALYLRRTHHRSHTRAPPAHTARCLTPLRVGGPSPSTSCFSQASTSRSRLPSLIWQPPSPTALSALAKPRVSQRYEPRRTRLRAQENGRHSRRLSRAKPHGFRRRESGAPSSSRSGLVV